MATGSFAAAEAEEIVLVQPHAEHLRQRDNLNYEITQDGVKVEAQEWKWNAWREEGIRCYYNENEIQKQEVPATLQHTHMDFV